MPQRLPHLTLSLGQMAWAINRGQTPHRHLLDQLRYLRLVGVPFLEGENSQGRGNRLTFGFEDLVETGIAVWAIEHGMKPKDISTYLAAERVPLRRLMRKTYRQQPDEALTAPWIKSRGREIPVLSDEIFVRIHDRYCQEPGRIDVVGFDADADLTRINPFDLVERFSDGARRYLAPLTRLTLELTAWALKAPDIRPGRVAQNSAQNA